MPEPTTPAGGTSTQDPTAGAPASTFTESDVNRIVQERLARDRARYADYDDLKAKATEYDELKKKDQTELEREKARADSAERERDEARADNLRMQVAVEKGLTPTQAKRLVGKNREELEADADELLEAFGGKKAEGDGADDGDGKPATGGKDGTGAGKPGDNDLARRPKENLKSGAVPGSEPEKSYDQIADEIAKADQF